MSAPAIETDYLVVGAGATAMAFVDTLLSEDADAAIMMVDRKHRPGGHWNDAYPFVRLHQPSLESHVTDAAEKNAMCAVVPSPERPIDWLRMLAVSLANGARWRHHAGLSAWLTRCRLNALAVYMRGLGPDDTEKIALAQAMGAKASAAAAKLAALLAASAGNREGQAWPVARGAAAT